VSKAGRIANALAIGYAYQFVVLGTTILLTPYILRTVGDRGFSLWLSVGQAVGILALLDFGVSAALGREVAVASGQTDSAAAVAGVRNLARHIVRLLTVAVGITAWTVWWFWSERQPELTGPLAIVAVGYTLIFPLRPAVAILTGLQRTATASVAQAVGWLVGTNLTVVLLACDWNLYGLAIGWVVGQCVVYGIAVGYVPRSAESPPQPRANYSRFLRISAWAGVGQLAGVLLVGLDVIVLSWIVADAELVAYSCTMKLASLTTGHIVSIMLTAQPALGQLSAETDRSAFWNAADSAGLLLLIASGAAAVVLLAVTPAFVGAWVGAARYAGPAVAILSVVLMTARHTMVTLSGPVFVLGYERRCALVSVVEGIVGIGLTAALAPTLGAVAAPVGSLIGLMATTLPLMLRAVAKERGTSIGRVLISRSLWLFKTMAIAVPISWIAVESGPDLSFWAIALATAGLACYAALVLPYFRREPLRGYTLQLAASLRRRWHRAAPEVGS
jgi:O-antigen/teichoic acid export membrane protein